MILQINPKDFITEFINPINELNKEGKIAIFTNDQECYSISSSESRTIHLYNTYKPLSITDVLPRCSLNIHRLVKGLQCIGNENPVVELIFKKDDADQVCSFSTKEIKFNIKLIRDELVDVPKFNVEVFKKFETQHHLVIPASKVMNIRKALEFSTDCVKFSVEQEKEDVYFFFGDKKSTSNHLDDIRILVSTNVKTKIPEKTYDTDILRMVLKTKNDFSMKLNDNGVMYIEIENNNTNLKYITSPLIIK